MDMRLFSNVRQMRLKPESTVTMYVWYIVLAGTEYVGTSHGVIPQSSREVVVPPSQQQYQTHSAASSLPKDNSLLHVGQIKSN